MVKSLEVHLLRKDKNGNKVINIDIYNVSNSVVEQRVRHLGRCYTYAPDSSARKHGIGSISIQL